MVKKKEVGPIHDNDEILIITIEELRRAIDWISSAYDAVKVKTLTFTGGGLTFLTFLYVDGKIFFPEQIYGKIFYIIGLTLIIGSIIALCSSLLPKRWEFSISGKDLEEMNFEDKTHYLQYVKNNYLSAYRHNLGVYEKTNRILNNAFYPLVLGAIILIILKIFGA